MSHVVANARTQTTAGLRRVKEALSRSAGVEPATVPARPDQVLSAPLVTLYVSRSHPSESRESFEILVGGNTGFRVALANDESIAVEFAGTMQYGVGGVRKLTSALLQFEQDFLDPSPEFETIIARMQKDGLKEQARQELVQQIEQGREDLRRLLS